MLGIVMKEVETIPKLLNYSQDGSEAEVCRPDA